MRDTLRFLRDLKRNNNREWFAANRSRYEAARQYTRHLTATLIAAVAAHDPQAALLTESDCTYRIYRDTRFSPDKRPIRRISASSSILRAARKRPPQGIISILSRRSSSLPPATCAIRPKF